MSLDAVGTRMLARGADGWRGVIGDTFSPEVVARLAWATGRELRAHDSSSESVLVAHDGRAESAASAERAAGVLAALGYQVSFAGVLPTPVATYTVRHQQLRAAFLVTASHNPAIWNGVKLKVFPGVPPPADLEMAIDRTWVDGGPVPAESAAYRSTDPARLCAPLIADVVGRFADGISAARLRVVVDGLCGVAGRLLAETLRAAGCDVVLHRGDPDPQFGGVVPDPMRPESRVAAAEAVRGREANVGFVVDGDGDRLGVIDDRGRFVWPHDVLALLARHVALKTRLGAIATTVSTGTSIRRVARALGCDVIETPIGFKHIAPFLKSGRADMGGGAVGDIGFRTHGFDRDPCVAALLLLRHVAQAGRPLSDLIEALAVKHGRRAYTEAALPWPGSSARALESSGRTAVRRLGWAPEPHVFRFDGVKFLSRDDKWVLLRAGTTEPVLRVYAEAGSSDEVAAIVRTVADVVGMRT